MNRISEYFKGDRHAWVTKNLTKQCYTIRTNQDHVWLSPTLELAEAAAEDWVLAAEDSGDEPGN